MQDPSRKFSVSGRPYMSYGLNPIGWATIYHVPPHSSRTGHDNLSTKHHNILHGQKHKAIFYHEINKMKNKLTVQQHFSFFLTLVY